MGRDLHDPWAIQGEETLQEVTARNCALNGLEGGGSRRRRWPPGNRKPQTAPPCVGTTLCRYKRFYTVLSGFSLLFCISIHSILYQLIIDQSPPTRRCHSFLFRACDCLRPVHKGQIARTLEDMLACVPFCLAEWIFISPSAGSSVRFLSGDWSSLLPKASVPCDGENRSGSEGNIEVPCQGCFRPGLIKLIPRAPTMFGTFVLHGINTHIYVYICGRAVVISYS